MKYETIEDLKRAEGELAELDRMIDQETNEATISAMSEVAGAAVGAGAGSAGGLAAVYFAGVVGFSGAGIVSGLAAIGAIVGGGMLAGIGIVVAAPLVLAGGGLYGARYLRSRKFKEARGKLRQHAQARREFLERLIREKGDLGASLDKYRAALERLTRMVDDLG
jgi:hypothetical protein